MIPVSLQSCSLVHHGQPCRPAPLLGLFLLQGKYFEDYGEYREGTWRGGGTGHQGQFPATTDTCVLLSSFIHFLHNFANVELPKVTALPLEGYALLHTNQWVNNNCFLFSCKHFIKFTWTDETCLLLLKSRCFLQQPQYQTDVGRAMWLQLHIAKNTG